ncbi:MULTISPECIES: SRPBCC family protein [Actinomadura]|uniref:SRPBCC family protein n=1 Tax=Actinomadura yumaensis TaxID=111807 RepID=A0ABW2CR47_9ACTN|nr:SRPBCC family protein [Actinomadura sp. J1-007]MWK40501.1 polyketide cyclase [Actinomadura sp. J1-007]
MIEVSEQVNAVRRRVGERVLEAGDARTVTLERVYDAEVEDVWDAVTNPERIPRWFLPVSGDLRLGGRYQLEGNAGGTIERCEPPTAFFATWEFNGEVSWIDVRLAAEPDGRTRLVLEHIAHVDDERWAEFGPGAVGIGWDMTLYGLSNHLATGVSMDPEEAAAWAESEDGVRLMRLSGEAWYEAHAESGADKAFARAVADRTIAAYTAAPES